MKCFSWLTLFIMLGIEFVHGAKYDNAYSGVWETSIRGETIQAFDVVMNFEGPIIRQDVERAIEEWADGIYELSNGGNRLAKVRVYSNNSASSFGDVFVHECGVGAVANPGGHTHGGMLNYSQFGTCSGSKSQVASNANYLLGNGAATAQYLGWAATMLHESMHFFYNLADEYSSAELGYGCNYCMMYPDISISLANGNLVFKGATDATWKKLKTWSSAYEYGTPFIFMLPGTAQPPSPALANTIYYIKAITRNDNAKTVTISIMDGNDQVITLTSLNTDEQVKNNNWYLGWTGNANVPFSVAWDQYNVDEPGRDSYHRWNFGTSFNGNPHTPQGRLYRKGDGLEFCSQWDVISGNCTKTSDWMEWDPTFVDLTASLAGRQPGPNDVYQAYDNRCPNGVNGGYVTFDQAKRVGDGLHKPDLAYISGWNDCRNPSLFPITSYQVPYVRVELNAPDARTKSRELLQLIWMDDYPENSTEVEVVLDYSGSMAGIKNQDARTAAKLLANAHFLAGPPSKIGLTNFNNSTATKDNLGTYAAFKAWANTFTNPTNCTSLYDGLNLALDNFSAVGNSKVLYLVSDGLDNCSSIKKDDLLAKVNGKNVRINTYAVGDDADLVLLADLASRTGGDYRGRISVSGINENTISALSWIPSQVGYSGAKQFELLQGQSGSFLVNPTDKMVGLAVYGINLGLNAIVLRNPQGQVVQPRVEPLDDAPYAVLYYEVLSSQLTNQNGYWTVDNKSGNQIRVTPVRYDGGNAKESMLMQIAPSNRVAYPNPVFITAHLRGTSYYTGLHVRGLVICTSGDTVGIDMNDDGRNGDAVANDGVYTGKFTSYTQDGHYLAQVEMDNSLGNAKSTYIGTSRNDSVQFGPLIGYPLEFIDSRGFDIYGTKSDDYSEPPQNLTALIAGAKGVFGRIDFNQDLDGFTLAGLDYYQSILMNIEASDSGGVVSIIGSDPLNVIETHHLEKGANSITLPAWKQQTGMGIVLSGSVGITYAVNFTLIQNGNLEVGRFEPGSGWQATYGAVLDQALPFEGAGSLHGTAWGWREIISRPILTTEISHVGTQMTMYAYIPQQPINPSWIGTIGLQVKIPSANVSFDLGTRQLSDLMKGQYNRLIFEVPESLRLRLSEPHPDVQFILVMNGEPGIFIDNLEFTGSLTNNVVSANNVVCPEPGCSQTSSISLVESSGSRRIVAMGDLWLSLQGHPLDWYPSNVHFGISSEDGSPLTGEIEVEGVIQTLNSYYQQIDQPWNQVHSIPIRITNWSGRPYRLNWWFN